MHYWWALQSNTPGRPGNHAGGPGTLAEQDIWAAHKKALRVKDHVCSAQCGCNGISSEGQDDEREKIVLKSCSSCRWRWIVWEPLGRCWVGTVGNRQTTSSCIRCLALCMSLHLQSVISIFSYPISPGGAFPLFSTLSTFLLFSKLQTSMIMFTSALKHSGALE